MKRIAASLALVLLVFGSSPVHPCHVAGKLRNADELTAAQIRLLSLGAMAEKTIPYELERAESCVGGMADIFQCEKIDLLSNLSLGQLGGGSGNDIWGWTDPDTGVEYALFGRSTGTAFVDLSDPENPKYLGNLRTHDAVSTWRDIKVYGNYAYIVADFADEHGMQVFDLTQLRSVPSPPVIFTETAHYDGFDRAHNIVIDEESGFAYATGSNTCSGGLHMIDIRNPTVPTFAGCFSSDGYTHDAQCVTYRGPDVDFQGREICFASNEDSVTIVDVTDKSSPTLLSRNGYTGSAYTHQGWLTEDHAYFVVDDELDERTFGHNTKTYLWDLTDLTAPTIASEFTATGAAIDHNQYVHRGYSFQANYQRGLRVLKIDAENDTLAEVAFFDSYPEGDGFSFRGAWSSYPFFDSGIVIVSDVNRGLFVLRPDLPLAAGLFEDDFETGDTSNWVDPPKP